MPPIQPFLLAAACLAALPAGAASVADWRHDLEAMVADIRLTHPDPYTKTGPLAFQRALDALIADLPALSEQQRMVRAMQLVALIGDGHTQLAPDREDFGWWYPFRIYEFSDGYFITSAHRSVAELAGAQVLAIAGRPVGEVAAAARSLMGADNAFDRMERLHALSSAPLMQGLGYAREDRTLELQLRLADGRTATRRLAPGRTGNPRFAKDDSGFDWRFLPELFGPPIDDYPDWIGAYRGLPALAYRTPDPARPPHLTYRRTFHTRALPEQDAYYIQLNAVGNMEQEGFVEMFRRAIAEMRARPVRALILDWRYNFGGDGSKVPGMIHEFIKAENDPPWRDLYLLTGRRTFSAAVMALDAFAKHVPHTIVGEPSGAAANHYGDADEKRYARTGLQLYVSTLWHQLDEYDEGAWYQVDVPAPFLFADYAAGRDPAVDPILRGEEMRSIEAIALADGGAAARAAYEARRPLRQRYPWWQPPRFQPLKRAAYRLLEEQKRPEDAVLLFELLTELYPDEWNSWESLGRAQIAAGRQGAGLESFRCALALDPNTFEDGDLRRAIAESGTEPAMPAGCPAAP